MKDLLEENGSGHIKLFGGGGGTSLPSEIEELHSYGITRIYSPDDGRQMGLEGMIEDLLRRCAPANDTTATATSPLQTSISGNGHTRYALSEWKDIKQIAQAISRAE